MFPELLLTLWEHFLALLHPFFCKIPPSQNERKVQNTNAKQSSYSRIFPLPLYTFPFCEKMRERKSEQLFKRAGHPHHSEASAVSRFLPGCSCQDFSYQALTLFLRLAELKPAVEANVYVWDRRGTSALKAAGWRCGRKIRSSSSQTALMQKAWTSASSSHIIFQRYDDLFWEKGNKVKLRFILMHLEFFLIYISKSI